HRRRERRDRGLSGPVAAGQLARLQVVVRKDQEVVPALVVARLLGRTGGVDVLLEQLPDARAWVDVLVLEPLRAPLVAARVLGGEGGAGDGGGGRDRDREAGQGLLDSCVHDSSISCRPAVTGSLRRMRSRGGPRNLRRGDDFSRTGKGFLTAGQGVLVIGTSLQGDTVDAMNAANRQYLLEGA